VPKIFSITVDFCLLSVATDAATRYNGTDPLHFVPQKSILYRKERCARGAKPEADVESLE
jgi:hypothetical protein